MDKKITQIRWKTKDAQANTKQVQSWRGKPKHRSALNALFEKLSEDCVFLKFFGGIQKKLKSFSKREGRPKRSWAD